MVVGAETHVDLSNMVRATFVVSLLDMETIKKWIIMKAQTPMGRFENYDSDEDLNYFGFIAGGLTRLDYPVPISYFGNCVGFDRSIAIRRELKGEDGMIVAANMIGNMIKKLDKEILSGAERWISDWKILFELEIHILIFGSPKINLYETDFGCGRPKKIEDITIDNSRAISLTERRESKGGIESLAVVFLVAVFAAASVSAQDLGDLAPAPAPAMDKGAAYSLGMSGAVICSSLFLSMLAFLKH
ncbi:hypothetical protein GH714_003169 [Hevea brasiliensis]|uniref:Uncharacterized protein n=1 Tax=Hevea brasiliensis TaxID=3981 RepID=A0A6A6L048_HEVBR|nr:hypothetical protein GH714_003169 [Hevea brasiliensis]